MDLSLEAAAVIAQLDDYTSAELVWVNPLAGRTYRLTGSKGTQFLKLSPKDAPDSHDVLLEAERLKWARERAEAAVPVPVVLETGTIHHVHWLRTEGLPGRPASDGRWRSDPRRTGRLLGYAVRAFHDGLFDALADCPAGASAANACSGTATSTWSPEIKTKMNSLAADAMDRRASDVRTVCP